MVDKNINTQQITLNIAGHQLAAVCLNPGTVGEPVILLHGITSSISFWQVNPARYLLDIGPCYSLSLPGHYPATVPDSFKHTPLTADEIVKLLDEAIRRLVDERPATLIGHSTGGFSVLALAAKRPEIARRVVSISGFAHGRWTGILEMYQRAVHWGWLGKAYFKVMYRMLMLHPAIYRWAMRFYAADSKSMYAHPDLPEAIERGFPNYQRLDLDAMVAYFQYMPQIDITAQLPRIQAQTLIMTGDHDPIVAPAQSEKIAGLVRRSELAIIRGAGHLPFIERAEDYNNRLSKWLAQTNLPV